MHFDPLSYLSTPYKTYNIFLNGLNPRFRFSASDWSTVRTPVAGVRVEWVPPTLTQPLAVVEVCIIFIT